MNEHTKRLAEKAGFVMWSENDINPRNYVVDWSSIYDDQLEKFAELIAKECMEICRSDDWEDQQGWGKLYAHRIKKHFGILE